MSGSNAKQILRVPLSIRAKTADELSRRCLEHNVKYQAEFHYFQISKVGNEWFAWYYADLNKFPFLRREANK
jgi:hypothetical protein